MTASVSSSLPSGPHMWPDVRIIAGIEASTMTSDGTCRLVMPRSESTIASGGPLARPAATAAAIAAPSGSFADAVEQGAEPVVGADVGGGEHVTELVEQRPGRTRARRGRR